MCLACGHIFTSPCADTEAVDRYYLEDFTYDGGAPMRLKKGKIPAHKINTEERRARKVMPIIQKHCGSVKGMKVLDVRTRSGALSELLDREGANVSGVDPFKANVDYATSVRNLEQVTQCPISELHKLQQFEDDQFDIVTAMTIHVLAHLPSPRSLLIRLRELTKPGALLFFDEKSILHPAKSTSRYIFGTEPAHYHHFTEMSMRRIFEVSGFKVLICGTDATRVSGNVHLLCVAQTPVPKKNNPGTWIGNIRCDPEMIRQQLEEAVSLRQNRLFGNIVRRQLKILKRRFL